MCSDVQERSGTSQCCQLEQGVGGKKCGSGKQVIVGAQGACKVAQRTLAGESEEQCHRR